MPACCVGCFLRFDLPDVRALEDYNPPVMTRVLAADGSTVATFAEQRRILIEFARHPAELPRGPAGRRGRGLLPAHRASTSRASRAPSGATCDTCGSTQGASTITQQLARNLFLHPDKTLRRKVQEALLALEIERQYTKEEILRFYCNQIYMGHGRYGLEAASRFYFGKPARELTLPEAAMLAGLIQRPERLSPLRNPDRALERRDHVLRRMVDAGYLTPEQAAEAARAPLGVASTRRRRRSRRTSSRRSGAGCQAQYGSTQLYRDGLEVETTLDPRLQATANHAVERGRARARQASGLARGAPARPQRDRPADVGSTGRVGEPAPRRRGGWSRARAAWRQRARAGRRARRSTRPG